MNWPDTLADYIALIRQYPIVSNIVSQAIISRRTGGITLSVRVELRNGWLMDCWERISSESRRYSYHVFYEDQPIIRWDNAAHHGHLGNFPHHQHIGRTIVSSEEMTVEKVLAQLETMI